MKIIIYLVAILSLSLNSFAQNLTYIFSKTFDNYKNKSNINFKYYVNEYNYYTSDTLKHTGEIALIRKSSNSKDYLFFYYNQSNLKVAQDKLFILYAKDTLNVKNYKFEESFKIKIDKLTLNNYNWAHSLPEIVKNDFKILNPNNFKQNNISKYIINKIIYNNRNAYEITINYKTNQSDDLKDLVEQYIIDTTNFSIYYYSESYKIYNYELYNFKEYVFTDVSFNDLSIQDKHIYMFNEHQDSIAQKDTFNYSVIGGYDYLNYPLMIKKDSFITLSSYKGKIVLLDFWYASCFFCLKQMPVINSIYKKYRDNDNIIIIGLNHVDNIDIRKRIEDKLKLDFPSYSISNEFNQLFNINSFPTLILLDKNQNIIYKHTGYNDKNFDKTLIKLIDGLL